MKKTILCLFLLLSFLCIFSGCQKEEPAPTPDSTQIKETENGYLLPDGRMFRYRLVLEESIAARDVNSLPLVVYTDNAALTYAEAENSITSDAWDPTETDDLYIDFSAPEHQAALEAVKKTVNLYPYFP